MPLTSTLRSPLGGGLTLERTLGAGHTLRLTIQDASGTTVFSEDLTLSRDPAPPDPHDKAEQVF